MQNADATIVIQGVTVKFTEKDVERFMSKVNKTETCWLVPALAKDGYGKFNVRDFGWIGYHRAAYILFVGSIPEGLLVLHRCDVRNCVNPEHLFLGTNLDNVADRVTKGRTKNGVGERHGSKTHPDSVIKGEDAPIAKLKEADVIQMRLAYHKDRHASDIIKSRPDVSPATIYDALRLTTWKHVPAPEGYRYAPWGR